MAEKKKFSLQFVSYRNGVVVCVIQGLAHDSSKAHKLADKLGQLSAVEDYQLEFTETDVLITMSLRQQVAGNPTELMAFGQAVEDALGLGPCFYVRPGETHFLNMETTREDWAKG